MRLKLLLLMFGGTLLLPMQISGLYFNIMAFSAVSLLAVILFSDKTFTNPTAIYVLFFYPYSLWFVFYSLITGEGSDVILATVVLYSFYGLMSFILISVLFEGFFGPTELDVRKFVEVKSISAKLVAWPALIIFLIIVFKLALSGLTSKREMVDSGGSLIYMSGFLANFITVAVFIAFIQGLRGSMKPSATLALSFLILFFAYLVMGERDYVFRFAFAFVCVYMTWHRKGGPLFSLIVLGCLVIVLPASQELKGVLVGGVAGDDVYTVRNIFFGEFASAARNTYMLVDYGVQHSWSYLYSDIVRGLAPFASSSDFSSTAAWYNNEYRHANGFGGTSGWGFSIVANGYVIGRGLGIFVILSTVSLLLNVFHRLAANSVYMYIFYLMLLSGAVYTIRADLAGFLALGFKVAGMAVIGVWLLSYMLKLSNKS